MPSSIKALLQIYDCSCHACGNTWTQCDVIVRTNSGFTYLSNRTDGGYDSTTFHDILKNPSLVEGYFHLNAAYPVCFRCLPLGLGEGWKTPAPVYKAELPKAKTKKPATAKAIINVLDD